MSVQTEIRERINTEIVAALQSGLTPWRKPWCALENTGLPTNVISQKLYRGINPLLLQLAAHKRGFQSKFWGTYTQWAGLGAQVKRRPDDVPRGAWGTKIVFWKPVPTVRKNSQGDEEKTTFPLLREYTVFNADQVEGDSIERFRVHAPTGTTVVDFEPAERMIRATKADIRHVAGLEAAYYRPPADYIVVPLKEQFLQGKGRLPGYYDTLAHELCHWSECRLGWEGCYALGELRAELGAAYLTAAVGVPQVGAELVTNNAKYLNSWIKVMQADARIIFQVSSAASKAADYILSFSQGQQAGEDDTELADSGLLPFVGSER